MERLTAQWGTNPAVPTKFNLMAVVDFNNQEWGDFDAIIQRLAAYENTGFEPEEISNKRGA